MRFYLAIHIYRFYIFFLFRIKIMSYEDKHEISSEILPRIRRRDRSPEASLTSLIEKRFQFKFTAGKQSWH